mmetsp:Transcript_148140/g.258479  ORF Transcript_148140/g.258479 Transcript_148140/m.258479 type:complete len:203 (+) Transcript_148140:867-1475(+)
MHLALEVHFTLLLLLAAQPHLVYVCCLLLVEAMLSLHFLLPSHLLLLPKAVSLSVHFGAPLPVFFPVAQRCELLLVLQVVQIGTQILLLRLSLLPGLVLLHQIVHGVHLLHQPPIQGALLGAVLTKKFTNKLLSFISARRVAVIVCPWRLTSVPSRWRRCTPLHSKFFGNSCISPGLYNSTEGTRMGKRAAPWDALDMLPAS